MNVASWVRRLALLSLFVVGAVGSEAAAESRNPLAEHVRAANDRFKDVSVAVAEGYAPIPCASGIGEIEQLITKQNYSAEYAVSKTMRRHAKAMVA